MNTDIEHMYTSIQMLAKSIQGTNNKLFLVTHSGVITGTPIKEEDEDGSKLAITLDDAELIVNGSTFQFNELQVFLNQVVGFSFGNLTSE